MYKNLEIMYNRITSVQRQPDVRAIRNEVANNYEQPYLAFSGISASR